MHSRIYQISKTPINKEDYIEESNYYDHWFTNQIADYVNGDTNRESDINWLKACYNNKGLSFGEDDGGEYFVVEDKFKYFADRFERFKNTLNELSSVTLDDFANGTCGGKIYNLKSEYDDEFGFYIDSEDTWLETFDAFIRYIDNSTKYYIGATIDYHW